MSRISLHNLLFGSLRRQLILGVALVHAVMMSLFIWDLTSRQQAMLLEQQTSLATALAQSVATSSAVWLAARDLAGLQEIVEAQRRYPELSFAMVLDRDGRVLAHSDRAYRGQYVLDLPATPELGILSRSAALVDAASPATVAGEYVGWVRIGVGQLGTRARLAEIVRSGALYALAAIAIGAVLAGVMGTRLTRRLYAIQSVADAVGAGRADKRVDVRGSDEAATLARQFNGMLDTLAARERELQASHDALKESEARLSNVMAATGEGIWDWDLARDEVRHNPRWCELLGLGTEFMAHPVATFAELVHEEDREAVMARIHACVAGGGAFRSEHRMRRGDGGVIWVLDRGDVVERDASGGVLRMVGSIADITERKRTEAELKDYREHLEERVAARTTELRAVVRELEAFAYSISHDLRAPLRGIDGFSQALLEEYGAGLDDTGRDYLRRVRSGSQRMGQLIDDLLNLSRVTRAPLRQEAVDLSALAEAVAGELRQAEPQRAVAVSIQPGLTVRGDAGLLRLALENLFANAWKYTRKQPAASIALHSQTQHGETVFCLQDNGAGFDMQYAGKLFGAFQRLHHSNEYEGTGIGLATVQRIVQRHGGRVWAKSTPGEGATFYFTLTHGGPVSTGA